MKRILLVGLGVVLIGVGIVGLFLPILQGWAMIFMGLVLVSPSMARKLHGRVSRRFFKKDIVYLDEWKRAGIRAGFTTRHFPLVLYKTDDLLQPENQKKLTMLLSRRKGDPAGRHYAKFALLDQVHGDGVAVIENGEKYTSDGFYHFRECDAVLTNIPGLTLLVLTADCLSVFLSAGSWIGLAHAGWRGTEKGIARKVLELICEKSGVALGDVKIAFGPRIGPKNYHFDLTGENRHQLLEAGAKAGNVLDTGICTVEENNSFYSFRREKENAGRLISFISRS